MLRSRSIPILVALAALAGTAHADPTTWREQSDFVRDAGGVAMITVENARGRITLEPSDDGRIHIRALKTVRGRELDDARRVARETLVDIDAPAGRLVVRVRYPHLAVHLNLWQNLSGERMPNDEVRLAIRVPPALATEIEAASGDVFSDGIRGNQRVRTASGDVSLQGAAGPVIVNTASGDVTLSDLAGADVTTASGSIQVEDPRGALQLRSASGDVAIRGAHDSVWVRSASGTVRVDAAPKGAVIDATSGTVTVSGVAGRLHAHSGSGDIDARVGRGLTAADLSAGSGSITLTLDPALACTLDAGTGSGAIDLDGSEQVTRHGRGVAHASYRGGGVPVGLRTVSGDIRVVVGGGR